MDIQYILIHNQGFFDIYWVFFHTLSRLYGIFLLIFNFFYIDKSFDLSFFIYSSQISCLYTDELNFVKIILDFFPLKFISRNYSISLIQNHLQMIPERKCQKSIYDNEFQNPLKFCSLSNQ